MRLIYTNFCYYYLCTYRLLYIAVVPPWVGYIFWLLMPPWWLELLPWMVLISLIVKLLFICFVVIGIIVFIAEWIGCICVGRCEAFEFPESWQRAQKEDSNFESFMVLNALFWLFVGACIAASFYAQLAPLALNLLKKLGIWPWSGAELFVLLTMLVEHDLAFAPMYWKVYTYLCAHGLLPYSALDLLSWQIGDFLRTECGAMGFIPVLLLSAKCKKWKRTSALPIIKRVGKKRNFEYYKIVEYIHLGLSMALLLIFLGFFFTQPKLDKEKLSAYECGFEPFESARIKFNIHYYLVAILFVVFDAEIILMFPWVVSSSLLFLYTFPVLLVFILILTAGYVFDWIHKLLKW